MKVSGVRRERMLAALGTDSDGNLARKYRLSKQTITTLRVRAGIPAKYVPGRPPTVPDEDLVALVSEGHASEEIARRLGYGSGQSVDARIVKLRKRGVVVPRRKPMVSQVENDALVALIRKGETLAAVAEALGVSYEAAAQRLHRLRKRGATIERPTRALTPPPAGTKE